MNEAGIDTDSRAEAVPFEVAEIDRSIAALNREIAAKQAVADRIERMARRRMIRSEEEEIDREHHLSIAAASKTTYPTGFVYFITDGEAVKIGFSAWPLTRMATLQNFTPRRLKLLAKFEGTMFDEHSLHREFHKHRIQGEWFRPNKKLLRLVQRHQTRKP